MVCSFDCTIWTYMYWRGGGILLLVPPPSFSNEYMNKK